MIAASMHSCPGFAYILKPFCRSQQSVSFLSFFQKIKMGGRNTTRQFIVEAIFYIYEYSRHFLRQSAHARAQQRNVCFSCGAVVAGTVINCEHALGPRDRPTLSSLEARNSLASAAATTGSACRSSGRVMLRDCLPWPFCRSLSDEAAASGTCR